MFTKKFWMDLSERVISSAAGGALAILLATGSHDWKTVAMGAGVAALVSLLKGLVASQVGRNDSASLTV